MPFSVSRPHRWSLFNVSINNVFVKLPICLNSYKPFKRDTPEYRLRHVCPTSEVNYDAIQVIHFFFFIRNVPVIFFKLVCQIYCIWGFKLWHVCLALWLIHYKRKPHKSVHVTNVKNIPFGFSINNTLVIFSNWSARSNTFGGMQAKACKPFSVSNALSDKTPQKRSCHKFKSHPLWFSINNVLVIFSNWSARFTTFGGLEAKACKPNSVITTHRLSL
jgi:hypothetical protein